MATATEIRDALERLGELDEAAEARIRRHWPTTLERLDEPDGTTIEIDLCVRQPIETLRRQLSECVDEELARLTS